jgi:hypothetical protein
MESRSSQTRIRLNLLSLRRQRFGFDVYRRNSEDENSEREANEYSFDLPVSDDLSERSSYWVSFEPGFAREPYHCQQNYKYALTIRYLFNVVLQSAERNLDAEEYVADVSHFSRRVEFVLGRHAEGYECVWVEPHYLQTTNKFGYLMDFRFRKDRTLPFNKEVQRLSLSLNSDYQSNTDYYADKLNKIRLFLQQFKHRVFQPHDSVALDVNSGFEYLDCDQLPSRRYIFGNNEEHLQPFLGVSTYGPLERVDKAVRFALIHDRASKPLVTDLAHALTGKLSDGRFDGLKSVFGMEIGRSHSIEVPIPNVDFVAGIMRDLEDAQRSDPDSIFLPLSVMDESNEATYAELKYQLLNRGYAAQNVDKETVLSRNTLKWSAANIAVALFAKAGGLPGAAARRRTRSATASPP